METSNEGCSNFDGVDVASESAERRPVREVVTTTEVGKVPPFWIFQKLEIGEFISRCSFKSHSLASC